MEFICVWDTTRSQYVFLLEFFFFFFEVAWLFVVVKLERLSISKKILKRFLFEKLWI